jgi:hypothetical protein
MAALAFEKTHKKNPDPACAAAPLMRNAVRQENPLP